MPPDSLDGLTIEELSDLLPELIAAFQSDTSRRLEQVRDAIAVADLTRLRNEVHTIKGSAKQMGAETMVALCVQMETAVHTGKLEEMGTLRTCLESQFLDSCWAMTQYLLPAQ